MSGFLHLFHLAANACGTNTGWLPSLYDGVPCGPNNDLQITDLSQIWIIVANVVRILVALAGSLAVIFIVVGGIFYITSAGDPGRIQRAKSIITQAITGLVVLFSAYAVITFIAGKF